MDVCLSIIMKNSVNAVIGGVGMLLGPHALKSLNSIEKIQLCFIQWQPLHKNFSCYSPTNASDETDIITFYNELYSLVLNTTF